MDKQSWNHAYKLPGFVNREEALHYIMAFVGGYFGAYSIFGWGGLFALAQTANMIHMMDSLVKGNGRELALRLTAVCISCTAILLTVVLQKRRVWDLRRTSILIDMAAVAAESVMPASGNRFLSLYPVFFAMGFQWCVFSKTGGYGSSTVFSSNNLRQCVSSYGEYYMGQGEPALKKARFFRNTLYAYHTGVLVWLCFFYVLKKTDILFCLIPLMSAWVLILRQKKAEGA